MDSQKGKIFVGGLKWETSGDSLKEYFEKYGEVKETLVVVDSDTGASKGFGFVTFNDPSIVDVVLKDKHVILGRKVDVEHAKPKRMQEQNNEIGRSRNDNDKNGVAISENNSETNGGTNKFRVKKIFVGGLPPKITEEEFKNFFEKFGTVTDVVVMYDKTTGKARGFGFVTFDSEDVVNKVLRDRFYQLNGHLVEVKKAEPREKIDNCLHIYNVYNHNLALGNGGGVATYCYSSPHWYYYVPWFGGWSFPTTYMHHSSQDIMTRFDQDDGDSNINALSAINLAQIDDSTGLKGNGVEHEEGIDEQFSSSISC